MTLRVHRKNDNILIIFVLFRVAFPFEARAVPEWAMDNGQLWYFLRNNLNSRLLRHLHCQFSIFNCLSLRMHLTKIHRNLMTHHRKNALWVHRGGRFASGSCCLAILLRLLWVLSWRSKKVPPPAGTGTDSPVKA